MILFIYFYKLRLGENKRKIMQIATELMLIKFTEKGKIIKKKIKLRSFLIKYCIMGDDQFKIFLRWYS